MISSTSGKWSCAWSRSMGGYNLGIHCSGVPQRVVLICTMLCCKASIMLEDSTAECGHCINVYLATLFVSNLALVGNGSECASPRLKSYFAHGIQPSPLQGCKASPTNSRLGATGRSIGGPLHVIASHDFGVAWSSNFATDLPSDLPPNPSLFSFFASLFASCCSFHVLLLSMTYFWVPHMNTVCLPQYFVTPFSGLA